MHARLPQLLQELPEHSMMKCWDSWRLLLASNNQLNLLGQSNLDSLADVWNFCHVPYSGMIDFKSYGDLFKSPARLIGSHTFLSLESSMDLGMMAPHTSIAKRTPSLGYLKSSNERLPCIHPKEVLIIGTWSGTLNFNVMDMKWCTKKSKPEHLVCGQCEQTLMFAPVTAFTYLLSAHPPPIPYA